jgi:radical SAM superfamily enzyme YgiQ (UPF0313 family)
VVLISTYELGRQPFGLASAAAWLRDAGADVTTQDLSLTELDPALVRDADLVGLYVPMHTATRLAQQVLPRIRSLNPTAHVCVFGLYAPMNDRHLRDLGADSIIGGEFEAELVAVFRKAVAGERGPFHTVVPMERLRFRTPDRSGLPPLQRYGHLVLASGETRVSGSTAASRGCRHRCRHCPLVPVYDGRFRIVDAATVMADVDQQVAEGAEHITFDDPDFLNGPAHAVRIVEALHARHPALTYDVTVKVEHLRRHRDLLPLLEDTGCVLVTTAVESFDDNVLEKLDKGHTMADIEAVVRDLRDLDLALNPTFVSFMPWTTLGGYRDFLETIARLGLTEQVAPIQYAIRLLLPEGSKLLELPDVAALVGPFDDAALCYPWRHPDPAVDRLHGEVLRVVSDGERDARSRSEIATELWRQVERATADAGGACCGGSPFDGPGQGIQVPSMSEPWYCCAEPTEAQLTSVATSARPGGREGS